MASPPPPPRPRCLRPQASSACKPTPPRRREPPCLRGMPLRPSCSPSARTGGCKPTGSWSRRRPARVRTWGRMGYPALCSATEASASQVRAPRKAAALAARSTPPALCRTQYLGLTVDRRRRVRHTCLGRRLGLRSQQAHLRARVSAETRRIQGCRTQACLPQRQQQRRGQQQQQQQHRTASTRPHLRPKVWGSRRPTAWSAGSTTMCTLRRRPWCQPTTCWPRFAINGLSCARQPMPQGQGTGSQAPWGRGREAWSLALRRARNALGGEKRLQHRGICLTLRPVARRTR